MPNLNQQDDSEPPIKIPPQEQSPSLTPPPPLIKRHGANLPHWRRDAATYAITFRLADSLPAEVLERWRWERVEIERRAQEMNRPLTEFELRRLDELHGERVETWLNQGHGSCAMNDPRIAKLVADAVRFFDGQRYDLHAWCVMPNHVHAVLHTYPGRELSMILLSWKGFTGKKAREMLGTRGDGAFWQKESYDHLVRDKDDLARQVRYVLDNPSAAGLTNWPWVARATARATARGTARGTALPGGVQQKDAVPQEDPNRNPDPTP